jgi:hypothetical protein
MPKFLIAILSRPVQPKRFALGFVGFVCIFLCSLAVLNWMVNPYGQFSSRLLEPIVQNSRSQKVQLFDQLSSRPDGLILGSSRALKFEPAYLEKKTSCSFFNFAVNHGRPEDFLSIVRLYQYTYRSFPRIVVIGVDIASLNDVIPDDARPSSEPRLFTCIRKDLPWHEEFDRYSQLLSYHQFKSSLQSLQRWAFGQRPTNNTEEHIEPDGLLQYVRRQTERAQGTYDFEDAYRFNEREFLSIFRSMKCVSRTRMAYLRETVKLCKSNGCKVTLFTTVHHPKLLAALELHSSFSQVASEATRLLNELAVEEDIRLIDFSSIDHFGGDATEFVDGIHPLEPNTQRMVDCMFPSGEVKYAVQ